MVEQSDFKRTAILAGLFHQRQGFFGRTGRRDIRSDQRKLRRKDLEVCCVVVDCKDASMLQLGRRHEVQLSVNGLGRREQNSEPEARTDAFRAFDAGLAAH